MPTNLERYKADLDSLLENGSLLLQGMIVQSGHLQKKQFSKEERDKLPDFRQNYQSWYSEALKCIMQLLPDRVEDFTRYYKPDKPRKDILHSNYTVSDYLQGVTITRMGDVIVDPISAVTAFYQQVKMVEAIQKRFESSLFDIRTLVQADLFDDELDSADTLNHSGYGRGGGALAGVVLEGHLAAVCENHKVTPPRNSTISRLNDLLKDADVIDVPTWRFIQHLGDLRNLCDHKRSADPTMEQMRELIAGVRKITKTVF